MSHDAQFPEGLEQVYWPECVMDEGDYDAKLVVGFRGRRTNNNASEVNGAGKPLYGKPS